LNSLSVALANYFEEQDARELAEKLGQVKTERNISESKPTEQVKYEPTKGHSARFYSIWWTALTKPTEANYRSIADNPNFSKLTAYWWILAAGIIFTNILVFSNFAPLAFAEMLLPIPKEITSFTPAEAQWLEEVYKQDPERAARTALQLKQDKFSARIELAIYVGKLQDFSLLDLMIANLIISIAFTAVLILYVYITDKVAKARGGRGNFVRLIFVLSAFTAPVLIIGAWIASLLVTDWMLVQLGFLSIPVFAGVLSLILIILATVATKAVNNFSWGNAILSSSALPTTLLLIVILPPIISYLDSIQVFGGTNIIGNPRP